MAGTETFYRNKMKKEIIADFLIILLNLINRGSTRYSRNIFFQLLYLVNDLWSSRS
jgi:hypothetical protein